MLRLIRHKGAFILLAVIGLFAIAKHYKFYKTWFIVLPDSVGYSIFTSLFMLSVYWNSKYCDATKIAVGGLLCLYDNPSTKN